MAYIVDAQTVLQARSSQGWAVNLSRRIIGLRQASAAASHALANVLEAPPRRVRTRRITCNCAMHNRTSGPSQDYLLEPVRGGERRRIASETTDDLHPERQAIGSSKPRDIHRRQTEQRP